MPQLIEHLIEQFLREEISRTRTPEVVRQFLRGPFRDFCQERLRADPPLTVSYTGYGLALRCQSGLELTLLEPPPGPPTPGAIAITGQRSLPGQEGVVSAGDIAVTGDTRPLPPPLEPRR